jgi:hypothetical protein
MWLQHVQRMDTNRLPKQALQYKPKGRRNIGRPRRDGGTNFILRINEQETRLTLQEHDDDDDDDGIKNLSNRKIQFLQNTVTNR